MDSSHDDEIAYLRKLSEAKLVGQKWFNHGRVMRPLDLDLDLDSTASASVQVYPHHHRSNREGAKVGIAFGLVMSSAWLSADEKELMITLTAVKRDTPVAVKAS